MQSLPTVVVVEAEVVVSQEVTGAGDDTASISSSSGSKAQKADKVDRFCWPGRANVESQAFRDCFNKWPLLCLDAHKDECFKWGNSGRWWDKILTAVKDESEYQNLTKPTLIAAFEKLKTYYVANVLGANLEGPVAQTGNANQKGLDEVETKWQGIIRAERYEEEAHKRGAELAKEPVTETEDAESRLLDRKQREKEQREKDQAEGAEISDDRRSATSSPEFGNKVAKERPAGSWAEGALSPWRRPSLAMGVGPNPWWSNAVLR